MATIPQPRRPICTRHHVFHVSCAECQEQHQAERDEARKRLAQQR